MPAVLLNYIICIMVLVIVGIGMDLQKEYRTPLTQRFFLILDGIMAYLLVSLGGELLEGKAALSCLNFHFNLAAFFFVDLIVMAFCGYLHALLGIERKKHAVALQIAAWSCVGRIVLIFVLTLTGTLFSIEDGKYTTGKLVYLPYFVSGAIMLLLLGFVIVNRKRFSRRQVIVIILYLVFPIFPIVIECFLPLYSLTGVSMTLSLLMVYILLQNSTIEQGKVREAVLEDLSTKDLLTGLNNRRAYYDTIANISEGDSIGVLFCDINGLKYQNDHFGHTAGDELLKTFGSLLAEEFLPQELYRISGDEFVVVMQNISQTHFTAKAKSFSALCEKKDNVAAIGYAYGAGVCFDRLIAEAEEKMYVHKRACPISRE